jgi:hypothetical protein
MVLTLGTDYSELRGLFAFPVAVLMYLGAVAAALAISRRRRRRRGGAWWLAVCWGMVFPVVQTVTLGMSGRVLGPDRVWAMVLPTSAVTAALLWWASRSWIPSIGCLVAWGATSVVGPALMESGQEWLLAVPWNLCVGASLVVWAWRVRRAVPPRGHCVGCGYDLQGLSGGVCPECGVGECSAGG